jgi:LmbE family N-acetylglucosaminyl deacetylase/SAM-dependent methyltransferase
MEEQALRTLVRLGLPPDARVLLLGVGSTASPSTPAGMHWRLERLETPDSLDHMDESFDAAIVTETLERLEWDRWALQQIHRRLRRGGRLLLAVPNLTAFFSPGAVRFVASRVLARIRGRLRPPGRGRTFAGRRYLRSSLESMLAALHFEVESWSGHRFLGSIARPARRTARPMEWGDRHFVVARRLPGLAARIASGDAPEAREFIRRYEADHHRFVGRRDRWLARHPEFANQPCLPLDPRSHAGARVLVLAPHADDELVGSAGTLLRLIEHRARVTVIHATDGSASAAFRDTPEHVRTSIRLDEARAVGAALGASDLHFWKEDNRAFQVRPESVERLKRVLRELEPDLIFTPFVTDIHPDHFTLNRILDEALAGAPFDASRCRILYSEIWSLVPANVSCDVTPVEERVERLIEMYTTAMKIDDLSHLCEARSFYNACRLLGRPAFVEAFFSAPATRHHEWMTSVGSFDE